jgi:hypothetical protein
VDETTVLATVPMWFGLTDQEKSQRTILELSKPEYQTDWGMRIISSRAPKYSGGGYHYGSVWPLFTGWASVAEYRYHRPQAAFDNLRANALLALDGSPGHVTEVLSGDYYQPLSTNSPHQIWSAAMVISPMLRGMFGLQFDAQAHTLTFAPHIPAEWKEFALHEVAAGSDTVDLTFSRTADSITIIAEQKGDASLHLTFSPALSPRAEIQSVTLNGKPLAAGLETPARPLRFHLEPHITDQHLVVEANLAAGTNTLKIRLRNDFAVTYSGHLPALGSTSQGLRVVSEMWSASRDALTLEVEGIAGQTYALSVWGKDQIKFVDGARMTSSDSIEVTFAPGSQRADTLKQTVTVHFTSQVKKSKASSNSKN